MAGEVVLKDSWQPPDIHALRNNILTIVGSALYWSLLFALAGGIAEQPLLGLAIGVPFGTLFGVCWTRHLVSWRVIALGAFAHFGAFLGPGCDAGPLAGALVVGWFGACLISGLYRGLFMYLGAIVGAIFSATSYSEPLLVLGVLLGSAAGYVVGGTLKRVDQEGYDGSLDDQ